MTDSKSATMTLDQFLKQMGVVGSGGQAKLLIQAGKVLLNGNVEIRRGKKLDAGDTVTVAGEHFRVTAE